MRYPMMSSTAAQLRYAIALARGRAFPDWVLRSLVRAASNTHAHRGLTASSTDALLSDHDPELWADHVRRCFARQVRYAKSRTRAYRDVPDAFTSTKGMTGGLPDFAALPVTTKTDYIADPDGYLAAGVPGAAIFYTSGSTGTRVGVRFSAAELKTMWALSAIGNLVHSLITPGDRVLVATWARAALGNSSIAASTAMVGAEAAMAGQLAPAEMVKLLAASPFVPFSVLSAYPSYLGSLITEACRQGLGPNDFALRTIMVGGEVVTDALLDRAHAVFGDHVRFVQTYGMTETAPAAGSVCEDGHLHFEPSKAVIETRALGTTRHARPGELATLVITPLIPFRQASVFIRYDTGDVVTALPGRLTCSMAAMPATSVPHGKLSFTVHRPGLTITPRQLLEVVEANPDVALPARISYRDTGEATLDVTVQVSDPDPPAETSLREGFARAHVPVRDITLVRDLATTGERAYPLRGVIIDAPPADAALTPTAARTDAAWTCL
ncbi:AMP-binding protein [Mycobacterium sp. OAE908]|uniref:phenylacetate--CoA ligase family protein n=1 Tax=Mycobacterium sp. OAE908 TaxID=2817899 RepID=UPI001AEA10D6